MNFREWIKFIEAGGFVTKPDASFYKPNTKTSLYANPKPHTVGKKCGVAGGPGPGGDCASKTSP